MGDIARAQVAIGVTRSELIDLERRIGERGLQLRHVRALRLPGGRSEVPARRAAPLNVHEETLIRAALLEMARLAP